MKERCGTSIVFFPSSVMSTFFSGRYLVESSALAAMRYVFVHRRTVNPLIARVAQQLHVTMQLTPVNTIRIHILPGFLNAISRTLYALILIGRSNEIIVFTPFRADVRR